MRLKIRCDGKSWKILGFWVEVNKTWHNNPILGHQAMEVKLDVRNPRL